MRSKKYEKNNNWKGRQKKKRMKKNNISVIEWREKEIQKVTQERKKMGARGSDFKENYKGRKPRSFS